MKYDKKVKIISLEKVSDGLGGWISGSERVVQVLDSFLTPVRSSVMVQEYGVSTNKGMKLFTKTTLNIDGVKEIKVVTPDGAEYLILEYTDFGKVKMLVLDGVKK